MSTPRGITRGTRRLRAQRNNRSSGIAGITVYVNADRRAGRISMADVERAMRAARKFRAARA